tara:strand:- start:1352 stop:1741 length:390 start_codon:yes stop_codon:yes gene_type:complete
MAHFALLDDNNVVTDVFVINNVDCLDDDDNESEAVGIAFCESLLGAGTYKQTSYNSTIRKQYAQIGGIYDSSKDKFIQKQPYASHTLNSDDDWVAPLAEPSDNDTVMYGWDESAYQSDNTTGWVAIGEA